MTGRYAWSCQHCWWWSGHRRYQWVANLALWWHRRTYDHRRTS